MKKTAFLLFMTAIFASTKIYGQTNIRGHYKGPSWIMTNDLKIKKNHSFKLSTINWETGNGIIHYGTWTLKNDTLMLEYKNCHNVKGIGKRWTIKKVFKSKEAKTETFLVTNSGMCKNRNDNDDQCYTRH